MKNADYWRGRFSVLEDAAFKQSEQAIEQIERMYMEAQQSVQKEIEAWYGRFAANNEITLADARKWLNSDQLEEFKWTVDQYIQIGQQTGLSDEWLKKLENASAKFHVSRLEALQLQIQQQVELLNGNQVDSIDALLKQVVGGNYTHTAFEIQKGLGIGWDITGLDQRKLETLISKPWTTDGRTFRDRCWTNKTELVNTINKQMVQGLLRGDSPEKAIQAIQKQFGVSRYKAARLVHTEASYFSAQSTKEIYKDLGVDKIEILETLDGRTCDICGGLDGTVITIAQYEPGVTVPPFHPNCRGSTCPYYDDMDGERAARNADGEVYYVPANMTYSQWEKTFVNGGAKEGLQEVTSDGKIEHTEAYNEIMESITANNVESLPVGTLSEELSEDEIIKKLSGGDMTDGSCSSLAFAYIGNKNGLDVTDYRGGTSRSVFARDSVIQKFLNLDGIKGSLTKVQKELSGTLELIRSLENDKEYYLAAGKHAAIIRNTELGLQYLEMQSSRSNGWKSFSEYGSVEKTLSKRFGCRKTADKMKIGGTTITFEKSVVVMEVDSFKGNSEFAEILSYVNTETGKQKKGSAGGVK